MAYFLPSYFQKRLLRYALSRLDFIDIDALDLDNLGLTIGQRSVIELKHVAIKVSKLVERLNLPPTVAVQHATIRSLRVTVPADLHASGIEVEINGVDVEVNVLDARDGRHKRRGQDAPSHKDISNRPRIASPDLHDPGGSRSRYGGMDDSILIPAPQDLAASFLQTESEQDRRELEAMVESKSASTSNRLDESVTSEAGLAEGLSLPGFVTAFFTGIADRFSLSVRNIAISVQIGTTIEKSDAENLGLLLKVEEVELYSVARPAGDEAEIDNRRQIRVVGIEVLAITDAGSLSSKSRANSPKMSRSKPNPAFHRNTSTSSPTSMRSVQPRIPDGSVRSASDLSSSDYQLGLGIDDSMIGSQIFSRSRDQSGNSSSASGISADEMPRHADEMTSFDELSHPSPSSSESSDIDQHLAQSTIYTHDEAESMYMSAMSNARMPGGFDTDEIPETNKFDEQVESSRNRTISTFTLRATDSPKESQSAVPTRNPHSLHILKPSQCAKSLLKISEVELHIPTPNSTDDISISLSPQLRPRPNPRSPAQPRMAVPSHVRQASDQSVYAGVPSDERAISMNQTQTLALTVGDIQAHIDVALCSLLLKTSTRVAEMLSIDKSSSPQPKIGQTQKQYMSGVVKSLLVNIMEEVPNAEIMQTPRAPTDSTFSVRGEDVPLLQLRILEVKTQIVKRPTRIEQKLTIRRFGLYREESAVLSFFDSIALQESMLASTILINSEDIVIQQAGERVEINTKPLHISLDLLVADHVLTRSGGLSSLLELGASASSVGTTKNYPQTKPPVRRRSVHFDDSSSKSQEKELPGLKINARISAVVVDLVGSAASLQIRTSAIKLVQRKDAMRIQISSTSIRGPILRGDPNIITMQIKLANINLEYQDSPSDQDLDRLLQLLVPSNNKYEQDDDIMVDTLLRQRRKGGRLHLSLDDIQFVAYGLVWTQDLVRLGEELSKLSSVTKYLPEDDRPGMLTLLLIKKTTTILEMGQGIQPLILGIELLEAAHITVPALMAIQCSTLYVSRSQNELLIHALISDMQDRAVMAPPMLMCRFIPDEMEPTVKLKLFNLAIEYSVPILLSITQLVEVIQESLPPKSSTEVLQASEISQVPSEASDVTRKIKFSLTLQDCGISLKPADSPACGLCLLTDASIQYTTKHDTASITLNIHKASIMIIDDMAKLGADTSVADPKLYFDQNDTVQDLVATGYIPIGSISAASADVKIIEDRTINQSFVDVEFRNNLFYLETCADSTQTLIQILGGLSPPSIPSKLDKFRTNIVPLEDMLNSFTGHAFVSEKGPDLGKQVDEQEDTPTPSTIFHMTGRQNMETINHKPSTTEDSHDDGDYMHDLYSSQEFEVPLEELEKSTELSRSSSSLLGGPSIRIAPVNVNAEDDLGISGSIMMHSLVKFEDNHFTSDNAVGGTAHRWEATQNTYSMADQTTAERSPLKVRVRDVHIIWNLFDGYDWQNTRDVITQAVRTIEDKAIAKQRRRDVQRALHAEEEDESVIGDVLFNSIYISIPNKTDPSGLAHAINMELGDGASETGSYATSTTVTANTERRHSSLGHRPKKLRLKRSKQHKMTFELEGLAVDFLAFPSDSGQVESSIDIRVHKLDIFDHVPTSTWKKFATYMHESGEREIGTDQVHIELLNVKPIADLTASEIVMKLTVLPLRLHVDQDALDFLTRFFEFKDDRVPPSTSPSIPPFIQRAEVNPIKLKLDFKPKRVDYAGLKSGRMTEFMNFIILDRADILLRRVILYGVSGFDRLGIMLNNIWTPDVRNNQLPTVLAGLAPVRSLVDVGSGVRDLVAVPIREYKKDGRIVRSIQKGALAFAKTTTTELVNLGAKLAIGTQTVLQGAEDVLSPQHRAKRQSTTNDDISDDEQPYAVSNYADQPLGIVQGLRGAYASLERDLLLAKDAVVAVPGEIMAEGSAAGAAKVVLKSSPTIILRPAIGVTKAVGTALLGVGNTLDKTNRRRIEDKYKRH